MAVKSHSEGRSRRGLAVRRGRGLVALAAVITLAFLAGYILRGPGPVPGPPAGHDHGSVDESSVWTCSMHPQIKLPEPGKCPICFMDLIPVESSGVEETGNRQLKMTAAARELAAIATTPVRRGIARHSVRVSGNVTYDEGRLAHITAWVPGRLDRLYADRTGITVRKGDHLAEIYSPDLLAAQQELIQVHRATGQLQNSANSALRTTAAATLEAAREKLRLLGLTGDQISRIEQSQTASDHVTIHAPAGGVVVRKDAREGQYVQTGARIYTIADLSKVWVVLDVHESDLTWVRYGQTVEFTVLSLPGERFSGTVTFIDPLVDSDTRTVKVRVVVDNSAFKLKPNMFVSGTIRPRLDEYGNVLADDLHGKWISPMHPEIVKDGPGTCDICGMPLVPAESLGFVPPENDTEPPLLIPVTAPLLTGTRAVVYVQVSDADGFIFEGREVELGPRAGDYFVVKSGLAEGESVVTNGSFKIDSELQLQGRVSMMNPAGATPRGHHGDIHALTPVYNAYFAVQEALAADDLSATLDAMTALAEAADTVNTAGFEKSAHVTWKALAARIRQTAATEGESRDLAAARARFEQLSSAMIDLQEAFGHADDRPYYLTYCPMAFDNTGAHWLQTSNTVNNSYFGAAMLRCGTIKKELPPVKSQGE